MERNFKVEGNIIYPDEKTMLTWGPFYYHSKPSAVLRMDVILNDITEWVNLEDPSLEIRPENVLRTRTGDQIVFKIKAWYDDNDLQDCNGIISVEEIFFED